jgi:hypothetical protein
MSVIYVPGSAAACSVSGGCIERKKERQKERKKDRKKERKKERV